MNPAWMIRMPMPNPACAADPNGRLTTYTTNRYTATSANSAPAGSPMARIFRHRGKSGFQAPRTNLRYAVADTK
jgi:hypothetical protein